MKGEREEMERREKKWFRAERRRRWWVWEVVSKIEVGEPPPRTNQRYLLFEGFG